MLLWNMQTMNITANGFESLPAMNLRLRRPNESDAPALAGTTAVPDFQTLLAIERLADGVVVGAVGLSPQGTDRKAAQITYWVDEPFRHDGLATEAVRRVAVWVFQDLGLEILSALLPKNHPAARRVLEKAGFTAVGEAFVLSRTAWLTQWAARPRVLVAAAALIDGDGRVLLTQRPPGRPMAGLWEFPGGKVHDGETPETALVREVREELGIEVHERCLAPLTFASHPYVDFHLLMPLYACRKWNGVPSGREGQLLRWVRPHTLASWPMPVADVPLMAALRDVLGGVSSGQ